MSTSEQGHGAAAVADREHDGRIAVVTGGAGGIGLAVVTRLLEAGAHVTIVDNAPPRIDRDTGPCCRGFTFEEADVSVEAEVDGIFRRVVESHGHVDYLVHCAAVFPGSTFRTLDHATWSRTLRVNLTGSFLVARSALREMVPRGSGAVVLFSSMLARTGGPDCAHYAAAKGGVLGLARALAREVAPHGVRVNTVSPGLTDTPQPRGHLSEEEIRLHVADIPMARMAQPADVAEAVLFLLGEESSYMTGQDVRVNGGWPLW